MWTVSRHLLGCRARRRVNEIQRLQRIAMRRGSLADLERADAALAKLRRRGLGPFTKIAARSARFGWKVVAT